MHALIELVMSPRMSNSAIINVNVTPDEARVFELVAGMSNENRDFVQGESANHAHCTEQPTVPSESGFIRPVPRTHVIANGCMQVSL